MNDEVTSFMVVIYGFVDNSRREEVAAAAS
jgi:hypothetical protein